MFKRLLLIAFPFLSLAACAQEIGVQLYSFRDQIPKDVPGTLKKIRAMGVTELEGGGSYGLPLADYKKLIDEDGFKMICIGASFDKLQQDLPAIIQEAKTFGATYVMCAWVPHKEGDFTLDEANKAIDVFNTAGKTLKENGLSLCYHAHGYEFRPYEGGTMFDYMAKKMNSKYANFEMDVFWVHHPGQDPVALLKKYKGRFPLMHLKDRKPGTEGNQNGRVDVETNVVLGSGDVGIAEIMKASKKYGVKHYFIEDESSRSMEQVPQSLAYLKSIK